MVGGKVIEVADVPGRPDILFVDCADRPYGKIETCAICVERNEDSEQIQIGDSLWWQGEWAMWTPVNVACGPPTCDGPGVRFDIKIPRVGYSGVKHPSRRDGVCE